MVIGALRVSSWPSRYEISTVGGKERRFIAAAARPRSRLNQRKPHIESQLLHRATLGKMQVKFNCISSIQANTML